MTTLSTPLTTAPTRRDATPPSLRDLDLETLIALYPPKTEPMGEAFIHLFSFVRILEILSRWLDKWEHQAIVFGDIMVYYRNEHGKMATVAPDTCVVFGVESERIDAERSYFIDRTGVVPALALEIGSRRTAHRDLRDKPSIYAHIGVSEYWMVDPTGGDHYGFALRGLRLVDGAYEEIEITAPDDGSVRGYSDVLGLELRWETHDLRFFDPASGEYLRTPQEIAADAQAAEARAQAAESYAQDAEAEIARLREMLGL